MISWRVLMSLLHRGAHHISYFSFLNTGQTWRFTWMPSLGDLYMQAASYTQSLAQLCSLTGMFGVFFGKHMSHFASVSVPFSSHSGLVMFLAEMPLSWISVCRIPRVINVTSCFFLSLPFTEALVSVCRSSRQADSHWTSGHRRPRFTAAQGQGSGHAADS